MMDDLISRAAAIAEFDECLQVLDSCIQELKELAALDAVQVVRCRDCKHYEVKDHWTDFGGVSILAASDVPTCYKWSDGCMTSPNGYCFLGERKEDE